MAALTYTGRKKAYSRPARTYDHLYDPLFRVSSNKDHMKQSFKAQTGPDKIRYQPHFKNMFSSLRHYPRQTVTLDMTDPVPPHVPRQWNGFQDQARDTLVRYKKTTYNPNVTIPPEQFEPPHVGGENRYKYFRRPIIPFLPQMPPNVVLAPTRLDPLDPPQVTSEEAAGYLFQPPKTRSVLVQTDYRDSEAQTEPYAPEHVVRPGSQPELLTLASLSYGRGLPAGLAEVEMIERARAKREWEKSLPPLDDLDQMDKRRRMMEEQERKEWSFREQEIESMQKERIEVIKQLMQQREVDHYALNSKRMEHFWTKKNAERDRHMRRLHNQHVKALRKLTAKAAKVECKAEKRNVIQQYSNFDSQVYAPMTRIGVYLDSGSEQYNVKSKLTNTLDGLLELEENLPLHVLSSKFKTPIRSAEKAVGLKARRQLKLDSILKQVYTEITALKETTGKVEHKALRLLKEVETEVPRPPTPTIPTPPAEEEEQELALVLLQRIIRGRAIQTKMFEGKERRQQLIRELRMTHALQTPEQKVQKKEAEDLRSKQEKRIRQQHNEDVARDGSEMPVASHLGQRLDLLTKELVRLQEERRVAAYVMLAERQRRTREAEESGRRQREERIRRTEDEMFKQMMRVHQGTVDTYLEDIILKSLEKTADEEARKEVKEKAEAINKVAREFIHTELSGKELAAEMVYSFLLPQVHKKSMREKVRMEQSKHLLAAHRVIHKTINDEVFPQFVQVMLAEKEASEEVATQEQEVTVQEQEVTVQEVSTQEVSTQEVSTQEVKVSTQGVTSEGVTLTSDGVTATSDETSDDLYITTTSDETSDGITTTSDEMTSIGTSDEMTSEEKEQRR